MLICSFIGYYGLTPVIADYMCSYIFYDQMHFIFLVRTPVRTSHNSPSENQKGSWRLVARRCHRCLWDAAPIVFISPGQILYHSL